MKTSSVSFAQLRRLLRELRFTEVRKDTYWRFEHAESGTIFVFRPYSAREHVTVQDIATTREHLDWHGLLAGSVFDDSLVTTSA